MRGCREAVTLLLALLLCFLSSITAFAASPATEKEWTQVAAELAPVDVSTNGKMWVLISGTSKDSPVYHSTDGLDWVPGNVSIDKDRMFCWSQIECSHDSDSWLILDESGNHTLFSKDGINWIFANIPEPVDKIFERNGFWYAYSETANEEKPSFRSEDGINWEKIPENDHSIDLVSWNGGENSWSWVRGVMRKDGGLYYSENKGSSWRKANIDEVGFGRPIYRQGFWIIGHFLGGGAPIYKSLNGLDWEPVKVNDFCSASDIEYHNGIWLTQAYNKISDPVTGEETIYDTVGYSKNGSDWKRINIATETDEFWLSYVGAKGIVVRNFNTGEYFFSDNAEDWEPFLTCDLSIPELLYNEASDTWILKGIKDENVELLRFSPQQQ